MPQPSKEPCKKEACDIQSCLTKNNFIPQRCLKVIELLQTCCERCKYNSTHCASVSGLLKTSSRQATTRDNKTIADNKKI
ncbi:cx9C motif-containing protein 4 [Cinnamomum micranthum f. kanehirae]|uniref:Cx9C motif-containing protein 4 n=1 Tax=Cinnamomum micranthum f. kanehirae TaxID=337451 RepID=A0A443P450_9MAGN|nr:cx9C motif-containing protein 4 [Cinnamomum micranthum f. kanehirae]